MHTVQRTTGREERPLVAVLAALMAALALVLAPAPALADDAPTAPGDAPAAEDDFDYTYDDGSLGFFEWLGAKHAVAVIEDAPSNPIVGAYQDLDNMGSTESAFNLDNMEKSLDIIERCNDLRALPENNAGELLVDPYLMAIGQVNMNYSRNNTTHSGAYEVAENLAWGYPDPFTGWYDAEKKEWYGDDCAEARSYFESLLDSDVTFNNAFYYTANAYPEELERTGHYLNVINPDYSVTGAGYIAPGSCSEQAFYFYTSNDGSYTVSEFRALLAEYRALVDASVTYQITATSTPYGRTWVSASKAAAGTVVTVRLTPDYAYEVDGLLVEAKDGRIVPTTPTGNPNEYTFVMPDVEVDVAAGYVLRFNDVHPGEWFVDSVMWAADNGVMGGYANGTGNFGPNDDMQRAQVASVLYKRASEPEADLSALEGYVDVGSDWYTSAVAWAVDNGVIVGDSGRFRPNDVATRQEFVTILWRLESEPEGTGDLADYPDGSETSDWARAAMEWATGVGIINGNANTGEIDPTGKLNRAQAATIIMNWTQLNQD